MSAVLQKILEWVEKYAPQTSEHLSAPASETDIDAVEITLGQWKSATIVQTNY